MIPILKPFVEKLTKFGTTQFKKLDSTFDCIVAMCEEGIKGHDTYSEIIREEIDKIWNKN